MLTGVRALSLLDHRRAAVRVPLRLCVSLVAAAAALGLVGALEPALGLPVLFPAFVGITFVSAKVAGTSYGIVTMALFGAGYALVYAKSPRALGLEDRHVLAVLAVYAAAGLIVARIGGVLRRAYARARDEHRAVTALHEQREDILRMLTHDIRTPLSAITMNAAMLARHPADPEVVLRRAGAIKKAAESAAGMLSDLVDAAHLESGQLRVQRRPIELLGFVIDVESRLEGTLPLDRVDLSIPNDLPAVCVDPQRFERILVNLLSNALKYAPSPTRVVLGAAVQDGHIVVSVADRGPGISQQDLPHIFEKYYRASGARKKEGLGIGLYATRLLVQAHGGRIWVESALGEGTTFHVALPLAPPTEPVAARASSRAILPSGSG